MNDDLTPPNELIALADNASAIVDGDVQAIANATAFEPDHRTIAGAAALDPWAAQVHQLVVAFQEIRAELADVPPASAATKQASLAAAMAVFDLGLASTSAPQQQGPADTSDLESSAEPVSLQTQRDLRAARSASTRRWNRIASVAAAVALVGVVGTLASQGFGRSNDDSTSAKVFTTDSATADQRSAQPEALPGTAIAATDVNGDALSTSAGAEQLDSAATDTTAAAAVVSDQSTVPTIGAINGPASAYTNINTPQQLAAYAQSNMPSPSNPVFNSTLCQLTDGQVLIGQITYQGTLAIIVQQTSSTTLQAIDGQSCAVLAQVTP